MVLSILAWVELETITLASCSRAASATQKPIPEVPPMTRIRLSRSLERYLEFEEEDIVMEI